MASQKPWGLHYGLKKNKNIFTFKEICEARASKKPIITIILY